jgi:hypothetical protein
MANAWEQAYREFHQDRDGLPISDEDFRSIFDAGRASIGRCETCISWPYRTAITLAGQKISKHRECKHPKLHDFTADDAAEGDEVGGIDTGPHFGCVHYEER